MPAQQFRKKPVTVEAVLVTDALRAAARAWADLPSWLSEAYEHGDVIFARDAVHLYRGTVVAERGDWLVRDVDGSIGRCSGEAFAATYVSSDQERG